jgi:hypothetical protein
MRKGAQRFTEFVECAAYLVGGWINVVLEEEKGAPQKVLFLFPDCERPLACGEGIERPLFQPADDTGGIPAELNRSKVGEVVVARPLTPRSFEEGSSIDPPCLRLGLGVRTGSGDWYLKWGGT